MLWGKAGEDVGCYSVMFATRDLRQVGVVSTSVTEVAAEAGVATANRLAAEAFLS